MNKNLALLGALLGFCSVAVAAEPLRIAVVPKAAVHEYWNHIKTGAMKAEADLSAEGVAVKVLWEGTAREDQIEEQKKLISKLVADKVDAIVLAPSHAQALVSSVEEAIAAKIPVVIVDSPIASERPASTVATNNYKAGLLAGRRLAESIQNKGNVVLFRYMKGHGSTQPRESGFLDAIKKFPEIKVVSADTHAGVTIADAEKNAKALLEKVGDVQGIFASNMESTTGMLRALRALERNGKVSFVGFDATDEIVQGVRAGDLSGCAVQQPAMMGYTGVRTAVTLAQGKSVDKEIDTDVKIVTKENIDTPEVKKLLGK